MVNSLHFDCPPDSEAVVGPLSMELRDYQEAAVKAIKRNWDETHKLLLVMATGTGKTVVFCELAKEVTADGGKVLILAHLAELLEQAADKLLQIGGITASLEKADSYASHSDKVVLSSWQTLQRDDRLYAWGWDHFDLIIVDEAHRSMGKGYQKIFGYFNTTRILGVTATTDRGDRKSLGDFYDTIAYEFGLLNACKASWLVRPIAKTIPIKIDLDGVRVSRTTEGSDLNAGDIGHRIEPLLGKIAGEIATEEPWRKHMVFLPTVDTAKKMSDAMNAVGFRAVWVSGACRDRVEKIDRFKAGRFNCLCNCMLLTEGFDHDEIDCITVLRPTKIRSLLAQCIGRGTRPLNRIVALLNDAPDAKTRALVIRSSPKPNLLILDFLWLTKKLNLAAPASLFARSPEALKRMNSSGDMIDSEEQAEKDYLESLYSEVEKHKDKRRMMIDPLAFAVALNDVDIAHYEPLSEHEARPPSPNHLKVIKQYGMTIDTIKTWGHAKKIYDLILYRKEKGRATPTQLQFLKRIGEKPNQYTTTEYATAKMRRNFAKWRKGSKKRKYSHNRELNL